MEIKQTDWEELRMWRLLEAKKQIQKGLGLWEKCQYGKCNDCLRYAINIIGKCSTM